MWSCAIVCVLLVGAIAQESPDEHKPCCAPKYFTYDQVDIITTAPSGELLVEYENTKGAYDAVSEQESVFFDADYFNGTEIHGRYIADYKESVLYIIIKFGEEEHCSSYHLPYRFHELCIPDDAKFVQETWLGENDLLVDSWYLSRPSAHDEESHIVVSVGRDECVPVNEVATNVNPTTGETLGLMDSRSVNFKLGICDREHFFKVPESCRSDKALKKPSMEMQKIMDKISRRRKFFGN